MVAEDFSSLAAGRQWPFSAGFDFPKQDVQVAAGYVGPLRNREYEEKNRDALETVGHAIEVRQTDYLVII